MQHKNPMKKLLISLRQITKIKILRFERFWKKQITWQE